MENNKMIEDLAVTRCLFLLFYNFRSEEINKLKVISKEFDYCWQQLEAQVKKKRLSHIKDTMFYELYANVGYETQACILLVAKERYWEEAIISVREGLVSAAIFKNMVKDEHM